VHRPGPQAEARVLWPHRHAQQWTRSTRSTTTKAKTTSTRSTKTTSTSTRTTQTTKAAVTSANSTSYAAPAPTATGDWYKPALGSSLLWSLESVIPVNPVSDTGIELNMDAYDVDLFDTSAAQIKTYKSRGKKVICYFSGGSYEPWRTGDKTKLKPECYCNKQNSCKMDGWDEWWLDLHTPACVSNIQQVMSERIALAKVSRAFPISCHVMPGIWLITACYAYTGEGM
jgi:hypothetical protein